MTELKCVRKKISQAQPVCLASQKGRRYTCMSLSIGVKYQLNNLMHGKTSNISTLSHYVLSQMRSEIYWRSVRHYRVTNPHIHIRKRHWLIFIL